MRKPLKALIVEDNPDDAELLLRELSRAGFDVDFLRVETAERMRAALHDHEWDVVLSDYCLPTFGALQALETLKQSGLQIPFIVMSGTIGEETAVEALKAGAQDFLVKGRLMRLGSSVERALEESQVRRERELAEQALRASEQKFRQMVETSQEGVWVIDAESRTTYVNARMAEMLDEPAEQLFGASLFDFVAPEWADAARENLGPRRPGATGQREFKLVRRGGRGEFWAEFSTSPISEDGHYAGALSMVTDVTEQRKLQAQLMVSDRMASVGILAAGVAHEINNPLSAAITNLELAVTDVARLAQQHGDSSDLKELHDELADAREAVGRVRDIVRDLKIFSRVRDEERKPVDLHRILESSLRMAWNEVRHRARVVKQYRPIPLVDGNESRLGQVFLNLIVNAAQAIPEGRASDNEIRLCTGTSDDGRVVVEVRDSGSGMPESVLDKLFTPFFTTKPIGVGTGLGLSICHRIVTGLGGDIQVESEVGKGTSFRVVLPAAASEGSETESTAERSSVANRRASVLVLDDEEIVGSSLRRALSPHHDVSVKTDARDALSEIRSGKAFDVILCDLMMPIMTGMEFHSELSAFAPKLAERVVFVTGGAFTPAAREFLAATKNICVEKPLDLTTLLSLVNRLIG